MSVDQRVKERAGTLLRDAVKDGYRVRPKHCEKCGSDNDGRVIEGHHPDYSRPFDVEWLCSSCHQRVHWAARSVDEALPKVLSITRYPAGTTKRYRD